MTKINKELLFQYAHFHDSKDFAVIKEQMQPQHISLSLP